MIAMTSSSLLLSLVLLLASPAGGHLAVAHVDNPGEQGLTHIHMYMHEIFSGPNATGVTVAPSPLGGNVTFGVVQVLDNELRDGPDPSNSSHVGRFQGIVAFAGLVSPPGLQSAVSFVFTAGDHAGGELEMLGTIQSFDRAFERAVVGSTGKFRFARGYCVMRTVSTPTPASAVYVVDLYVKMGA